MATYWLSFRLENNRTYSDRYESLTESVRTAARKWWTEPSSFLVFECEFDIDTLADRFKRSINPTTDILLLGMPDFKSARIIGAYRDPDIFELMPFAKKA